MLDARYFNAQLYSAFWIISCAFILYWGRPLEDVFLDFFWNLRELLTGVKSSVFNSCIVFTSSKGVQRLEMSFFSFSFWVFSSLFRLWGSHLRFLSNAELIWISKDLTSLWSGISKNKMSLLCFCLWKQVKQAIFHLWMAQFKPKRKLQSIAFFVARKLDWQPPMSAGRLRA